MCSLKKSIKEFADSFGEKFPIETFAILYAPKKCFLGLVNKDGNIEVKDNVKVETETNIEVNKQEVAPDLNSDINQELVINNDIKVESEAEIDSTIKINSEVKAETNIEETNIIIPKLEEINAAVSITLDTISTLTLDKLCSETWDTFDDNDRLTVRTIGTFAREDSPTEYERWHELWVLDSLYLSAKERESRESLVGKFAARVLWQRYVAVPTESSTGMSSAAWYRDATPGCGHKPPPRMRAASIKTATRSAGLTLSETETA